MAFTSDLSKLCGKLVLNINDCAKNSCTSFMDDNLRKLNLPYTTGFGFKVPTVTVGNIPICDDDCSGCHETSGGVVFDEFKPSQCHQGFMCIPNVTMSDLMTEYGISLITLTAKTLKEQFVNYKDRYRISSLAGIGLTQGKKTEGKTYTDGAVALKDFTTDLSYVMDNCGSSQIGVYLSHEMYFLLQQQIKKFCCEGDMEIEKIYDAIIHRCDTDKLKTALTIDAGGGMTYGATSKAINWIIFCENSPLGYGVAEKIAFDEKDCNFNVNMKFLLRHDLYVAKCHRKAVAVNTK